MPAWLLDTLLVITCLLWFGFIGLICFGFDKAISPYLRFDEPKDSEDEDKPCQITIIIEDTTHDENEKTD